MPAKPQSWEDILGGPLPLDLPPVPPNHTPYVDDPQCPRDCSGRHSVDSLIECEACKVPAYRQWVHEYRVNRGVNFHTLEQVCGAPTLLSAHMPCPVCGGQFSK